MQAMGIETGAQAQAQAQQLPPNPLADLAGTRSNLAPRVVQFVSAILAVFAMVSADDFSSVSAFSFLVAACSLQTVWSLSLAVLDVAVMVSHYPLQNDWAASKFIFGDVITGTLTFCAAAASLGIVVYLRADIETCAMEHCTQFQNATASAFISFAAILLPLVVNYVSR